MGVQIMSIRKRYCKNHKGIALVVAMIFVAIFAALSVGFLSLSSANTQISSNHKQGNNALNAALSGLEMVRYWCSNPAVVNLDYTPKEDYYDTFFDRLKTISLAGVPCLPDGNTLEIGPIDLFELDNSTGTFTATVSPGTVIEYDENNNEIEIDIVRISITGKWKQLERKISVAFKYLPSETSAFDFGVATKGPLSLKGGTLTAATVRSEADVYIESLNDPDALEIVLNKSEIAGVAKIANPFPNITAADIKGKVGGLTGQDAIDQTITVGVPPAEFPQPNVAPFFDYVKDNKYTGEPTGDKTLTNMFIEGGAGTAQKPLKFTGNTTINGILYIKQPNYIDFGGNVTVNGMIVAEGNQNEMPQGSLSFTGSVDSQALPDDASADLRALSKGTFLMAPGSSLSFTGSFNTINGAIAGNGIKFDGNAGGTIKGSVINYSTTKMEVNGSSDIIFNRSGIDKEVGAFKYRTFVRYAPASYSEI